MRVAIPSAAEPSTLVFELLAPPGSVAVLHRLQTANASDASGDTDR
jgi:hypothetical protein